MQDAEALYAALAAVAAIIAAVQVALLLALDSRTPEIARQRGTNPQDAGYEVGKQRARRVRNATWGMFFLCISMGVATILPWGNITFQALHGGWRFVLPWAATVVAIVLLAVWAAAVACALDRVARG